MLYNIPINVFIDQDDAFDNIKFHKNCDLKYMGCDTSYKTQVLAFYSMKDDNDVNIYEYRIKKLNNHLERVYKYNNIDIYF